MQLKTIEQILRRVYSPDVSYDDMVEQAITQDRADIRSVLEDGIDIPDEFDEWSFERQIGFQLACKSFRALIDTLLPGDVSK